MYYLKFKYTLLVPSLVMFMLTSCLYQPRGASLLFNKDIIVVDLDNIRQEGILNYSAVFEKITPIALETTDNSLIGQIDALQVYNGNIYVLDRHIAKKVFVFDSTGVFIQTIGHRGNGPGEFTEIADFTINQNNGDIYILAGHLVHQYKNNGTYIGTIRLGNTNTTAMFIQYVNNLLFTDVHSLDKNNDFLLQSFDMKTGQQKEQFLPSFQYNRSWNEAISVNQDFFLSKISNTPVFVELFMDTIVKLTKDGILPFVVIKSKKWVTENDLQRLIERTSDPSIVLNLLMGVEKIYGIHNYIENENFILFKLFKGLTIKTVLIDLKAQKIHFYNAFKDDMWLLDQDTSLPQFCFANSAGMYSSLIPSDDSNPTVLYYRYK